MPVAGYKSIDLPSFLEKMCTAFFSISSSSSFSLRTLRSLLTSNVSSGIAFSGLGDIVVLAALR
ncbi:hypothetical protein, partial [Mariniflexile sp.]|uniref:hypothetical protein n=1 Tax=Mariniflexile sp. TaxID=1979402 RepID=UPI003566C67E